MTLKTKKTLSEGEVVLHDAKLHWIMLVNLNLFMLFLLAMLISMLVTEDATGVDFPFMTLAIVSVILFALFRLPAFFFTDFVITEKRLIGRTGMIRTHMLNALRDKVDNIDIKQSLLGRILKYGTIEVRTVTGLYKYRFIRNPEKIRQYTHSDFEHKKT